MNLVGYDEPGLSSFPASLRDLFLGIFVLLLCAGFSQPGLDDRHPGLKAPVATGKLLKPQKHFHDLDDLRRQRSLLALGGIVFFADFYANFVRFDRKQNPHLWPGVTFGHQRSPPLYG